MSECSELNDKMCFPEDDLPKNVLLSEFTKNEIENISTKATKLFNNNLEELIADIEFKQSDLSESIRRLISFINQNRYKFAQGILVKRINSLYQLIADPEKLSKDLKDSVPPYKFFFQISELSKQLDLCLLKVLFDFTKVYESLYLIPLNPSVVLRLYAKSCEIAMKLVDQNQKKKLEKCRSFFWDSAEWITSQSSDWPSKIRKKHPNFKEAIRYVKKLMVREK